MNALKNAFVDQLRTEQMKLTGTQKKLRQYLLDHVADVGYMSLKELSEKAGVSEVSILNFGSLWGFDNYISLREAFREYTRSRMKSVFMEPLPTSLVREGREDLYRYCTDITDNHDEMIRSIDLDQLEECARALIGSRYVLIFAHDMSKIAADYLASRLTYLRIRSQSVNLGDNDTVQMLLSDLDPGDSVVIFSFPPYYMPGGDVADYVRHCGAKLITIIDSMDSPAAKDDSINFLCRTRNHFFFNSMSVPIHFVEILVFYIAITMGKDHEDIVNHMNAVGSYFLQNKNRGDEAANDKTH